MTALLPGLTARINEEHAQCEAAARTALEHAFKVGELLVEAKAQVSHGQWVPWVEANCSFSTRTAQGYMRVFSRRAELSKTQRAAPLSLRGALAVLAAPASEGEPDWAAMEENFQVAYLASRQGDWKTGASLWGQAMDGASERFMALPLADDLENLQRMADDPETREMAIKGLGLLIEKAGRWACFFAEHNLRGQWHLGRLLNEIEQQQEGQS